MRAPRSLLLLIGGAALVAGAVLAFAPYSGRLADLIPPPTRTKLLSEGMRGRIGAIDVPCARPITGAFADPFSKGGWLNYAPPDSVTFSPGMADGGGRVPCATSARWRLGGGVVLMVGGAAALVVWTRQSRLGREGEDGVSDASPPPLP